mgnify:FL=1
MTQICLVFDLDDTLYPEASFNRSGYRAAGRWAEQSLGLTDFGATLVELFDDGRRGDVFNAALTAHGRPADEATVARLVEVYRTHTPELTPFEDAIWALAHYGAQAPLGLVTDGYLRVQQAKVAALGIANRFRQIVYTDALGGQEFWKPNPAGFAAIERAVPEAKAFVYIADNATKDFIAPNARGWRTIRIVRPLGEHRASQSPVGGEPHDDILSLMRLPDLLGS